MTAKYIAPYFPFAIVDGKGMATANFQAFWNNGLQQAVDAALEAQAAQAAAATAQTAADTAQTTAEAADANANTRQPASTSLTALAALSGTGLVEQTGTNAFTDRAIGVAAASSIPTTGDADGRYVQQKKAAAPVYTAYSGQTVGAVYSQAQAQATDDAVKALAAIVASLITTLKSAPVSLLT
jgi:hypothetical protein